MITRAQAEALLTLAESLEACERVGVVATVSPKLPTFYLSTWPEGLPLNAAQLREVTAQLMPK